MCFKRSFRAHQIVFAFLAVTLVATAQPPDAFVVERSPIPTRIHTNREMVLWMISPTKHDRFKPSGIEGYSCPEWTQGYYYSGPTRISLVDTLTKQLINTVKLRFHYGKEDSFDIPFRIIGDLFYTVPGHDKNSEGKPALLLLRDLNGDGLPLETAFFEAEACMGLQTTLIGYSPKQDRVIQYEVQLQQRGVRTETTRWFDYLFAKEPVRPGHWSYTIDYSGRGGCEDSYKVRYDPAREKFFATRSQSHCAPDP